MKTSVTLQTTLTRKPFQGVGNIVRFNWHFYVLAALLVILLLALQLWAGAWLPAWVHIGMQMGVGLAVGSTLVSLVVSYYVYDYSDLYQFQWLANLPINATKSETIKVPTMVNIHAGFDETSEALVAHYSQATWYVFDFYAAAQHTEVSIERARKVYPPYPNTQKINTSQLPLAKDTVTCIFCLLAAHEIRNNEERVVFFKQLQQAIHPTGCIVVVEHLRDIANFLAYQAGFFHFLSRQTWLTTFASADLQITKEFQITPFLRGFVMENK